MGRNRHGRQAATVISAVMTAGLFCLLLFFYVKYDYPRSLKRALETVQGEPLRFSRSSGFYEEGFRLELEAVDGIPAGQGIEIRYTVDGDDPGAGSLLYDPDEGIDLQAVAEAAVKAGQEREAARAAAVEKAKQEEAALQAAESAGTGNGAGTASEKGKDAEMAADPADAWAGSGGETGPEAAPGAEEENAAVTVLPADEEAGNAEATVLPADEEAENAAASVPPTAAEAEAAWEMEKWLSKSDAGVYPVRTDDGICVIPVRACLVQGEDRSRIVTRTYVVGENADSRFAGNSRKGNALVESSPEGNASGASGGSAAGSASAGSGPEGNAFSGSGSEGNASGGSAAGGVPAGSGPDPDAGGGEKENFGGTGVYVVSVTTDSANLFDYDTGIMVKGSHYEKDVANGVREDRAGNFYQTGPEWVKDGHVTLFAPDGEVLLEEDAGFTISGYSSRTLTTRSFRAEASAEHGTSGEYFHLEIFADDDPEKTAPARADAAIDLFQKIKFRSHGVPNYHIRSVRNQYAKILTDACGFPGLVENRLGVMYLNGEFYTVCDITPSTTRDYLARLFRLHVPDAVEKLEGSDYDVYTQAKIVKLLEADLTDRANREALERAVDMDNYLFYMAIEVLLNNADWPFNNVTMWRYLGEEDPSNPYTDGRFRFVLDDMDQILSNGLHGDPARWSSELIDYLLKDKGHTFSHVMACKTYRDTFLTYVDDLLQTAFEPDHACAVLEALYSEMKEEYLLDYGEEFWAEMEETAKITKQNVREKESLYRADIEKYMGLKERTPVRIEAEKGLTVTWNHRRVTETGPAETTTVARETMYMEPGPSWTGEYYSGTSILLTAEAADGSRFAGWEVNGELRSKDPVFTLEIGQDPVTVRAVAK